MRTQKVEIRKNWIFTKLVEERKLFKLKYHKEITKDQQVSLYNHFKLWYEKILNLRQLIGSFPRFLAEVRLERPVLLKVIRIPNEMRGYTQLLKNQAPHSKSRPTITSYVIWAPDLTSLSLSSLPCKTEKRIPSQASTKYWWGLCKEQRLTHIR